MEMRKPAQKTHPVNVVFAVYTGRLHTDLLSFLAVMGMQRASQSNRTTFLQTPAATLAATPAHRNQNHLSHGFT